MPDTFKGIFSTGTVIEKNKARILIKHDDDIYNELNTAINENEFFDEDMFWLAKDTIEIFSQNREGSLISDNSDKKIIFLLIFFTLTKEMLGSTRYPLNQFNEDLKKYNILNLNCSDLHSLTKKAVFLFTDSVNIIKPFFIDTNYCSVYKTAINEELFIRLITERLKTINQFGDENEIKKAIQTVTEYLKDLKQIILHENQISAVSKSFAHRTLIITGGPGTGKTTIALSIIKFLTELGELSGNHFSSEVALTAPTGRAANRLFETIKTDFMDDDFPHFSTIHRLLGFSPVTGKFSYHSSNKLDYKLVIVDEASMIDLFLFTSLLKALKPDTRLILLGDAKQLPSVDKGTVFMDIIPAKHEVFSHIENLVYTYRQSTPEGKSIVHLADYLNNASIKSNEYYSQKDNGFHFTSVDKWCLDEKPIQMIEPPKKSYKEIDAFVSGWYSAFYKDVVDNIKNNVFHSENGVISPQDEESIKDIFDKYNSSRVLCISNYSYRGTIHVNNLFKKAAVYQSKSLIYAGAPIIILRNKYSILADADLYNGDMGIVLTVSDSQSSPELKMVFKINGKFRVIGITKIYPGDYSLAYSITVHKSQGSEYEHVAFILPEDDNRLLTREILYTAVTRAKKSVTIFGNRELLEKGRMKSETAFRDSVIREKLCR